MVLGGLPLAAICAVQESDALLPRLQQLNGEAPLLFMTLDGHMKSDGGQALTQSALSALVPFCGASILFCPHLASHWGIP